MKTATAVSPALAKAWMLLLTALQKKLAFAAMLSGVSERVSARKCLQTPPVKQQNVLNWLCAHETSLQLLRSWLLV